MGIYWCFFFLSLCGLVLDFFHLFGWSGWLQGVFYDLITTFTGGYCYQILNGDQCVYRLGCQLVLFLPQYGVLRIFRRIFFCVRLWAGIHSISLLLGGQFIFIDIIIEKSLGFIMGWSLYLQIASV